MTPEKTVSQQTSDLPPDARNVPQWLRDALDVPREEGWVTSGDCPIHYFRWGDPSKPGIIMMHGFLAHARCFAFIAPILAEGYHIVAYDFSGMGDSGARDAYPEEVRVSELVDVAHDTGMFNHAIKPTLIAHSYGGNIGLAAMETHQELFSGLIICDLMTFRPARMLAHFGGKEDKRPGSQDPDRKNRIYPDYVTAKGRFVLSPAQETNEPSLFDYMAYHSLKQVDTGWTWKFDPSVFRRDEKMEERWGKQGDRIVAAPGRKVIVYGQQSELFDDDSAAYVRECGGGDIPMIGIPNARHHLMLDQPIAFACVLDTILALWHQAD